jgi:fructose-1,6-bisphosphatase/sedoheptulose 1,7-bisphosphatase-like protein
MPRTPIFDVHAGFSPDKIARVFPPNMSQLTDGIMRYRAVKGYNSIPTYEVIDLVKNRLPDTIFYADGVKWQIKSITAYPIANPIAREEVSRVERAPTVLVPSIAAAVAAHGYMGLGGRNDVDAKSNKKVGDRSATEAMRNAFDRIDMEGFIRGGEGGGRDGMTRRGALFMDEEVGTGGGMKRHFLVDPLEVTNASLYLQLGGGWGSVGSGWAPDLVDPANWYPGYSGATSLMLAIDADVGEARLLSDFLYLNKLQFNHDVWSHLRSQGFHINSDPKDLVEGVSAALRIPTGELRAGALARSRHLKTMKAWIKAGLEPWNISTPSDGDAMFSPAIASKALHFAGLTGGVMEGVISGAIGIPLGVRTLYQFVSHDTLGEHKEEADLLNEDHRFGFSYREHKQMRLTELFDCEHIGHTLRAGHHTDDVATAVTNAAFKHMDDESYDAFFSHFLKITGQNITWTDEEHALMRNALDEMVRDEHGVDFFYDRMNRIIEDRLQKDGVRFTDEERAITVRALEKKGFLNVRDQLEFGNFVEGTHHWVAAVSAITPNKWAPLEGIRSDGNGSLLVDTLVVTGAHGVYMVTSKVKRSD